jgi:mannose-6-phosphate isomerase-like protein (cupin superfamily)
MNLAVETLTEPVSPPGAGVQLNVLGEKMTVKGGFDDGSWAIIEVEKNPDSKVPAHHHPWDEIYYILSGGMRMMVDGRVVDAPAGTSIHIPADVVHQPLGPVLPNTRFLDICGPGQALQLFRALAHEVQPGKIDRDKVAGILSRHHVTLANP